MCVTRTVAMSLEGQLLRVCDENPNLVAFISHGADRKVCGNALVLIVGLTDGFLALAYTEPLSRALLAIDYSLVLVNLSSSWNQYGFRSLASDSRELEQLVPFLKTQFGFRKIVLLGHSTGAQDALYFLRYGKPEITSLVNGVILESGVSDREGLLNKEPYASQLPPLIEEAKKLVSDGKGEIIISERVFGDSPITANRLLSLMGRLTADDMFSTDLTEAELDPILQPVKVPISLCYSEQDQYIHDIPAHKEFTQKMAGVLRKYSSRVECKYYTGDHGLSKPEFYESFVKDTVAFVATL